MSSWSIGSRKTRKGWPSDNDHTRTVLSYAAVTAKRLAASASIARITASWCWVSTRRIGAAGSSGFASSACAPAPAQRITAEIANALGISRGNLVLESAILKNLLLHIIACPPGIALGVHYLASCAND